MRNTINQKYFENFADELAGKFRRINHLTTNARVAIGNYHEEILKVAIRNFLSNRYSVKTGYIYYDDENISNQIDILIIDENYSFSYLFKEGDFAIVKPEAVVCAIEVKSVLDKKNFELAFSNITQAKTIKQKSLTGGLVGLIFGYESPVTSNQWLEKCFLSDKLDNLKDSDSFWPNAILFFSKAEFLLFDSQGNSDRDKCKYYSRLYKETSLKKKDNYIINHSCKLAVFISYIIAGLGNNEMTASNRFVQNNFSQLVDHDGQKLGIDGFRIGVNKSFRNI